MTAINIKEFFEEKECLYDGERYSVRDNGAVLRHSRIGQRRRRNDDEWTFGKENKTNPYLHISGVRIHRIVATAFHGAPPNPQYVVDHIDTNCRNNRPENLRWLTRLENSLLNPVTRKKIEFLCGSIEAFLENPSMLNNLQGDPNFTWMRTVTKEEAQSCKVRMHLWSKSKNLTRSKSPRHTHRFEKRIYKPLQKWEVFGREPGLDFALTPWCAQYMWRASVNFPICPEGFNNNPLEEYFLNLQTDALFAYSDSEEFCPRLSVIKAILLEERKSILVKCKREDGRITIVGIILDEKTDYFIHFYLGSYSSKEDADESFLRLQSSKDWWGASLSLKSENRI